MRTSMTTPVPFRFDGHGINDANGQRIAKVSSCEPYVYPDGVPQRNAEFDALSHLIAAAPDMLEALQAASKLIVTARKYFPKSMHNSNRFELENTCASINAAIAKAEGR